MTVEFGAGTGQEIVEAVGPVCPCSTALRGDVTVGLVIDSEPELSRACRDREGTADDPCG